jgi:glycosyltransferase involved in cell wall biosynthesis
MASKKLKIAYVIDTYDGIKTGGVYSAHRFINGLSKNHEITIVTTGQQKLGRVILPGFYPPFARSLMEKMGYKFAFPKKSILREVFSQADLVHVQMPWWLGMRSVALARELHRPVVTGFHVQPENILRNIKIKERWPSRWIYRFFVEKFFNVSDGVICPSEFAQKELKRFNLKKESVVISNGLKEEFRPLEFKRDPEFEGKFVILAVGRLAPEKRLPILIKAISQSKYKHKIQMIATGQGPLKEKLIKMGQRLPLPAKFLFVDHEELIKLYNTADLYVQTSEVELEGMAVLEAIGCGIPALISKNPTSASAQFVYSKDFSFHDDDYGELARKIDYLIENPLVLQKAKAGYLEMASHYKFETSLQRTEDFYLRILKNYQKVGR